MAKNKTTYTEKDVTEFISEIDSENRRADSLTLLGLYHSVTGFEPKMYGPTIVGFGNYHYKYVSGHQGDAPLAAFSPRKNAIVLYLEPEFAEREALLSKLGKFRISKACVYINKLEDIDLQIVRQLVEGSIAETQLKYPEE